MQDFQLLYYKENIFKEKQLSAFWGSVLPCFFCITIVCFLIFLEGLFTLKFRQRMNIGLACREQCGNNQSSPPGEFIAM